MLNELIINVKKKANSIVKTTDKSSSSHKGWKKIDEYLTEIQSILKDGKLIDDCFDTQTVYETPGATRFDVSLISAEFTGKNYKILIETSEPQDPSKENQRSKTFQVLGFYINNTDYGKRDLSIFNAIAEQVRCKFIHIVPSKQSELSYNMRLQSQTLDLQTNPSSIGDLVWIINNVQNGTEACELYVSEQEKYSPQIIATRLLSEVKHTKTI